MWAFWLCSLGIFREVQVWMAWPCCNSHRTCSGNSSFLPLEHAQLLSWRSLWLFPDIVYGKSSGGCEPTLLAICTIYLPVPHPILTFSMIMRRKDFIDSTVSPLMSWASIIFSIHCDNWVLRGISSVWWVTCLACFLSTSLISSLCTVFRL